MASHFKPSPQKQKGAPKRGRRLLWAVPVVIVVLLAAVYLGGAYAFGQEVFLPGTTLDGEDVSLRPFAEVSAERGASLDGYALHVTGNGLDLTVGASDIGLSLDGDAYVDETRAQVSPWAWPLEVTRTRALTAEERVSYDAEKLSELVDSAVEAATSAATTEGTGISYDAGQGAFVLDAGATARHLSAEAVLSAVEGAIDERREDLVVGDECLEADTAVQAALDTANSYLAAPVALTLAGTHVADVTPDMIAGWTTIGSDYAVSLDGAAIEAWCRGDLSNLLDSLGKQRTYTRPDGKVCTVSDTNPHYSSSTYGWSIDGGATAEAIVAAIQGGSPATVNVPALQSAAKVNPGGQDWPDRYIDVDLTEQHARFYDGGSLIWEADCTTGQPNLDQETPTGVWVTTSRKSAATDGEINLRGPVDPATGEPEWSSYVDFWVGVVGNLVGFHNAPWQSVFGGNIYTYYGSHGCIRLSYASAKALYEVVRVGDVVVIHK